MKFSVSEDYTLGIIDVLDYKKSIENWDFINLFPLTLGVAGKGSFYHPFLLNFSDPLFNGLELCLHEILGRDIYGPYEGDLENLEVSKSNLELSND